MKRNLQKTLLAIACLLCCITIYAHDFEVDGIYYNKLSDTEVEVTYQGVRYDDYDDEYIDEITIPENITYNETVYQVVSIGFQAFRDCKNLISIFIPNSVTSIKSRAFYACSKLRNVTLSNKITEILDETFYQAGIRSLTIPEGVQTIEGYAFQYSSLKSITLPSTLRTIGARAFDHTSLESIVIPDGVKGISMGTFGYCQNLVSIYFPKSITQIDDYALESCTSLKELYIEATTPPYVYSNTFKGAFLSEPILYVPKNSIEDYKSANYWKSFKSIQAIKEPDVIATSLTLDNEVLEMYIGDAVQLTATVLPNNTTNKVVTWTSSDNEVATVDENGNVTAVSIGTVTITATTTDGSDLSASCEVTVEQKMVELTIQSSYYNNIVIYELPGTEKMIKIYATDEVYKLNSVWFNGEEVTNEVVDGVYTTPVLEEDAYINISFIIPTGLQDAMSNSRIKAYGYKGDVVVVGCERGENIAIYDVDGVMLRSVYATSNTMRIAMPTDAVYVVQVSDMAVKVAL